MAENSKKAKSTGRRKKTEAVVPGLHSIPKEVVEIERNLIESWLMSLKQWFQLNIETARKIILGIVAAAVIILIAVFIHSAVIEKQNSDFYKLVITYDSLKKKKSDNGNYKSKIEKLRESSEKLCGARWATEYSNAGCLVSSLLSHELEDYKASAESLKKFSDKSSNFGFSSYSALIAGYLFEKTSQTDISLSIYKDLLSSLNDDNSKDIALYNYGRLLYHKKNYQEAEKMFQEIIDNHKNSLYQKKARQYLMLININKP